MTLFYVENKNKNKNSKTENKDKKKIQKLIFKKSS